MLSLAQRPIRLRLAQAVPAQASPVAELQGLLVTVVDTSGRYIPGADVKGYSRGEVVAEGLTDSHGDVLLPLNSGPYDIAVNYKGHSIWKVATYEAVAHGETIFIQFPMCVTDPIVKPMDLALLGISVGLVGAGMYWKVAPLKTVGEIVFGAAAFGFIYRLSCL